MASSRSSDPAPGPAPDPAAELAALRRAVRGDDTGPGLAQVLPLLQVKHRRELRKEERWSKEELVRHPEPRQLIRAMRKPGNLDEQGRPLFTLDERRFTTADIHENRFVRGTVDDVHDRLLALAGDGEEEATVLLAELERALHMASFLSEVGPPGRRGKDPTVTLMRDPLYRAVVAIRP